jgi:VCBS repeat-containing protein
MNMQSEYIFASDSEGTVFNTDQQSEAAIQIAAAPQTGEALETPLLHDDAAKVVVAPGQDVVRVPVTPGEVIELPFAADSHFEAKLGDGNLAIKVGDVTVILQGYQAEGGNPPVIEAADGTPIDIATILAETDPNINIQTAAGPGTAAGAQGADNGGAIFQQLGAGDGLGGFQGAGAQDGTDGPGGGTVDQTGTLFKQFGALTSPTAPEVLDLGLQTDEDTKIVGQLTGTDPQNDPLTFHTVGAVPPGLIVNSDGTYSYDPSGIYQYLAAGDKEFVTFQYQANDGKEDGNIATVTIEVDGLNDPAAIKGDNVGKVKEDVTAVATGQVTVSDVDHDQAQPAVASNVTSDNGYGTWSVDDTGKWTYTLDNTNPDVNALPEGATKTDTFTIVSADGTASHTVTITITGTNDVPTITGDITGDVSENFLSTTTGKLTVTDPDTGESFAQDAIQFTSHGGYAVDKDGNWQYTLFDGAADALVAGETMTDTFTVKSKDGTASQVVTITIHGEDDQASITGTAKGSVTEDSGVAATGTLTVSDVDKGQNKAEAVSSADSDNHYGTWSVNDAGKWTFTLDDSNPTVNALSEGEKLTDTFTVKSFDGSASQLVTITIIGANDKPIIDSNGGGDTAKISIDENATTVTTVHATDVDKSDTLTYSISGGADASLFSIDKNTGALTFKNAPDFENPADSGKDNVYDVVVKASDNHGGSDTQALAVTVKDVNEPTVAADDFIYTTETSAFFIPDAWFLANDAGQGLKIDSVTSGANAGYFDSVFGNPTPAPFFGNTLIDLDTTSAGGDKTYLKAGDHTSFDYVAKGSTGSTDTGTVEITYLTGTTIDRSADTHNDIIVGSSANDTLIGGSGNDTLHGSGGNDLLFGGTGIDSLYGSEGDDVMRYSEGDNAHGGTDLVQYQNDLSGEAADRGDVLAFGQSINLTEAKYQGQFDGIETISLLDSEGKGAITGQSLTIGASQVNAMSDHTITPGGIFSEERAVRIDMDAVDQLYLSISKDGGTWTNTGKSADGAYDIFVHDTSGASGSHEDAYVMVSHAAVVAGNVHPNQDAP